MEKKIFATGRRGCVACIELSVIKESIVALAERDKITPVQMMKAVKKEFPRHTFYNSSIYGSEYIRLDADRWTGDGL